MSISTSEASPHANKDTPRQTPRDLILGETSSANTSKTTASTGLSQDKGLKMKQHLSFIMKTMTQRKKNVLLFTKSVPGIIGPP